MSRVEPRADANAIRFDYAPLAYPILFKTVAYTALVGAWPKRNRV
jgi:hypothetical protein